MVQEKVNLGIYTREQAQKDPMKNVLVRSVGIEEEIDIDYYSSYLSSGDLFLVCSDGLYGKVSDEDILDIINRLIPSPVDSTPESIKLVVEELIKTANDNGGQDNISVILNLCST